MKTLNVKIIGVDAPPNTNLKVRVMDPYYMGAQYITSCDAEDTKNITGSGLYYRYNRADVKIGTPWVYDYEYILLQPPEEQYFPFSSKSEFVTARDLNLFTIVKVGNEDYTEKKNVIYYTEVFHCIFNDAEYIVKFENTNQWVSIEKLSFKEFNMTDAEEKYGVGCYLTGDDAQHPTLVIQGERFSVGYSVDVDTGELTRECICDAWYDHECVCGAFDDKTPD